jgi:hypothetical protein
MSRSTKKGYINLKDYMPEVLTGYIYKLLIIKVKKYIGSTNDYKSDGAIKDKGVENFLIEVIKTVDYIDTYHLQKHVKK